MSVIDKLTQRNEFPIVFIGAGLSKRYLNDFPDWTSLLEELWKAAGLENFYGEINNVKDEIKNSNPQYSSKELEHHTNIKVGSILEENFNRAFNNEQLIIESFTPKDAYFTKISPFKKAISNRFKNYQINNLVEEYESFKKMLAKTQIILTTNYDSFLEDSYNNISNYKITKYIGQKGFFQETYGYAELYKLHGCVESPSDIVITENDYDRFEKNSVLISAKIISMMLYSPIIFIGYSLTDINVRKIIKDFTSSLNDSEIQILEERLILVEWEKGVMSLKEEVVNDGDLGCKLKVIKTDNYQLLFDELSKINQGIAPTEVRKYQHVIKQLIIDRGKKGALQSVLISPEELDHLEENIQNMNLTVAIGDAKYIFQIPDIITYCLDYISDNDEISNEIRMRFVAIQHATARLPMNKLLKKDLIKSSSLNPDEKEKLLNKIEKFSDFDIQYKTIASPSVIHLSSEYINVTHITSINTKDYKKYETISYYIINLNLDDVKTFLLSELNKLKERGEHKIVPALRRLLLIYDIVKNKESNA